MNMKNRYILKLILLAVVFMISCYQNNEREDVNSGEKKEIKFLTASDPGPWKTLASDHVPEVTVMKVYDLKTIHIRIPFTEQKDSRHFVEVIVILDLNGKELKNEFFERGVAITDAKFVFPANFIGTVSVVMKCNKHKKWEKKVDL
jgi:desulfoferrodoxin (superoxide reductase-like protein)